MLFVSCLHFPLVLFWAVTLASRTLLPVDNLFAIEPWHSFASQLGVGVPHNELLSDLILENYVWKQFIRSAIANQQLPLWNPQLFSGLPFLAAGQHSAMYPLSILFYVLPLASAYGWFSAIQLTLAGVFMYVFGRVIGVEPFRGAIGRHHLHAQRLLRRQHRFHDGDRGCGVAATPPRDHRDRHQEAGAKGCSSIFADSLYHPRLRSARVASSGGSRRDHLLRAHGLGLLRLMAVDRTLARPARHSSRPSVGGLAADHGSVRARTRCRSARSAVRSRGEQFPPGIGRLQGRHRLGVSVAADHHLLRPGFLRKPPATTRIGTFSPGNGSRS